MTKTSNNKLWQAAKALLVEANVDEGIIVPIEDHVNARVGFNRFTHKPEAIEVPYPPTNDLHLSVLGHELGHVVTTNHDSDTVLWQELKATLWGFRWLAQFGLLTDAQLEFQQFALKSYLDAINDPLSRITNPTARRMWDEQERGIAKHPEHIEAFMAAKSINDPKLQKLLKGNYDRNS